VTPAGWGSIAHIAIDGESGDIKGVDRVPTKEDELFMQNYLRFLENEFEFEDFSSEFMIGLQTEDDSSDEEGVYSDYKDLIEAKMREKLAKDQKLDI
jgi:hypothetical protein